MPARNVVPIGFKTHWDDRVKLALDAMPVAVTWTRLEDGTIEFVNQRFSAWYGYGPAEFGSIYELIDAMFAVPVVAKEMKDGVRSVVGTNIVERIELPSMDVLTVRKDGSHLHTSFSGVVLPEAGMILATFADISAVKERELHSSRLAAEDPLTGLANRRVFDAEVRAALQSGAADGFALVMLDLDNFKTVNDSAGHDAGDAVLKSFSKTLKTSFRAQDTVSRWGGDEFAVLVRSRLSPTALNDIVGRLNESVGRPLNINGVPIRIGVSAGIAHYPQDSCSLNELYAIADGRMYRNKRQRKARQ